MDRDKGVRPMGVSECATWCDEKFANACESAGDTGCLCRLVVVLTDCFEGREGLDVDYSYQLYLVGSECRFSLP